MASRMDWLDDRTKTCNYWQSNSETERATATMQEADGERSVYVPLLVMKHKGPKGQLHLCKKPMARGVDAYYYGQSHLETQRETSPAA